MVKRTSNNQEGFGQLLETQQATLGEMRTIKELLQARKDHESVKSSESGPEYVQQQILLDTMQTMAKTTEQLMRVQVMQQKSQEETSKTVKDQLKGSRRYWKLQEDFEKEWRKEAKDISEMAKGMKTFKTLGEKFTDKKEGIREKFGIDNGGLKKTVLGALNVGGVFNKTLEKDKFIEQQKALGAKAMKDESSTDFKKRLGKDFEGAYAASKETKRTEAAIARHKQTAGVDDEEYLRTVSPEFEELLNKRQKNADEFGKYQRAVDTKSPTPVTRLDSAQGMNIFNKPVSATQTAAEATQNAETEAENMKVEQKQTDYLKIIAENTAVDKNQKAQKKKEEKKPEGSGGMLSTLLGVAGGFISGMLGSMFRMLSKGLMVAFRALLNPGVILRALGKVFAIGMIVGALFEGIMDGFNEYIKTGDIGKALIAGLAGIIDFITFGLFDKEKIKEVIGDFSKWTYDHLVKPFTDFLGGIKDKFLEFFGFKGGDHDKQVKASNTSASKDFAEDAKQPVKPRPQDPLKAQVWDSKYASGWNPDGSAKSASPAAAPADSAAKMPAAQVANVAAEKSKYRMGLEQEFAARSKAANGYALGAGNGTNPDGTANEGMKAFMANEDRMRELDRLIEKDENERKSGKPAVQEVSKNKAPEKVAPAPAVAQVAPAPAVAQVAPAPVVAQVVPAPVSAVSKVQQAKIDAENTRQTAKTLYQTGTKEEEAARQKLEAFKKANPFDIKATGDIESGMTPGKFTDPKKQKEYDALKNAQYDASDKKEKAKKSYQTADNTGEYKFNKAGQEVKNIGSDFAKLDALINRFGYKESDFLREDGKTLNSSKINQEYDKRIKEDLLSTATPKPPEKIPPASKLDANISQGQGQQLKSGPQGIGANQPTKVEKFGPNWTAALKDYDSSWTPADHLSRQFPGINQKFIELAKKNPPRTDNLQSIESHEKMLVAMAAGEMKKGEGKATPIPTPAPITAQVVQPEKKTEQPTNLLNKPVDSTSTKKSFPAWEAELKRLEDPESSTPVDHLTQGFPGIQEKYRELAKKATPRSNSGMSIQALEQQLVAQAMQEIAKPKPKVSVNGQVVQQGEEAVRGVQAQPIPSQAANQVESKSAENAFAKSAPAPSNNTNVVNAPSTTNNNTTQVQMRPPIRNEESSNSRYSSSRFAF
jgi:hypothetical protein